jgi:hypothetical protein
MEIQNEHRLTAVEDLAKSNRHRIDDLERRQNDLDKIVSTVQVMAEKMKSIENTVIETKDDVKGLKGKDGERWNGLVDKAIWAVAAAVIGFLLAQIGLG